MKKILALLMIALLVSCRQDTNTNNQSLLESAPPLQVKLYCEDIAPGADQPQFAVYAIINESKAKITEIGVACQPIEQAEFATYEIPDDALSAVGGWWAGAGDYFYAKKEGKKVGIYYAGVDEAMETPGYPYQRVATYDNGKFSVSFPSLQ